MHQVQLERANLGSLIEELHTKRETESNKPSLENVFDFGSTFEYCFLSLDKVLIRGGNP